MALVKCPECQKPVSTTATACPSCGAPVKRKPTFSLLRVVLLLIGVIGFLVCVGNAVGMIAFGLFILAAIAAK